MNGPAHYREAERLLKSATEVDPDSKIERYALSAAQAHATLALVAATIETAACIGNGNGAVIGPGWEPTWEGTEDAQPAEAAAHTYTAACDGFHPIGQQCNLPATREAAGE